MEASGKQGRMEITNVVFVLAPRINAAGRMDDAEHAVRLFVSADVDLDVGENGGAAQQVQHR